MRGGLAGIVFCVPLLSLGAVGARAAEPVPQAPPGGAPLPGPPVLTVPVPSKPILGPADGATDGSGFVPLLPRGTSAEQVARDPAEPVTDLVKAIERAYWTNPQLLAERSHARSLDYRIPEARGQYGPQLEYSASYGYQRDNYEQPFGNWVSRAGWTSAASAVLRQPLFTFGRLRAAEDEARSTSAFGQASLREAEQQTIFNAINAYAALIRDRIGVRIAADNVDLLASHALDTQTRLEHRESTATDVQQVDSRLELSRAQLLSAQSAAAASEAAFLRYVGASAGELAPPNPLVVPARTLDDAYVYAADHNPVLVAAHARERISRAQVAAAKAEMMPRIELTGSASYGTSTPYTDGLHISEFRGGVTVSGTLDGSIRTSRIREAEEANDSDWRLLDEALRENREEIAVAWNEWQAQDASIARLWAAVDAARSAFDGGLVQERAGLRTTLDILELARDLLQARSSYNTASAAAYVAQTRLLAALGALDLKALQAGEVTYDAAGHVQKVMWRADFPLVAPLVRALDGLTIGSRPLRPVRDPAAPLAVGAAPLKP